MYATSPRVEFLRTLSKLRKGKKFLVACLRPPSNMKLGIFTSSPCCGGNEMYKKERCTCKVIVLPIQPISFLIISLPPPSWDLEVSIHTAPRQILINLNYCQNSTILWSLRVLRKMSSRFCNLMLSSSFMVIFIKFGYTF